MMDCGPACLRMVAKWYGKHYTLQTLREKSYITREGVSMLGISDAAESIGFHSLGVRITVGELVSDASLPCILHWNNNHFVVLYRVGKRRGGQHVFHIADPASGCVGYRQEEFERCWCGTTAGMEVRLYGGGTDYVKGHIVQIAQIPDASGNFPARVETEVPPRTLSARGKAEVKVDDRRLIEVFLAER